jgi:hypothetical protein
LRKPDYPDAPVITLKSVVLGTSSTGALDSLMVTIRFTDGNGDLGLTQTDRQDPPFSKYLPKSDSSKFNLRYYNFYLTLFAENNLGRFDTISNRLTRSGFIDEVAQYGAFAPTEDMNQGQPIEGTILYTFKDILMALPGATPTQNKGRLFKGKRYYIKIRIIDRAGNSSNAIESPMYTY